MSVMVRRAHHDVFFVGSLDVPQPRETPAEEQGVGQSVAPPCGVDPAGFSEEQAPACASDDEADDCQHDERCRHIR